MADILITLLVIVALIVFVLMGIGLLMMWCTLIARFVRWVMPRPPSPPE